MLCDALAWFNNITVSGWNGFAMLMRIVTLVLVLGASACAYERKYSHPAKTQAQLQQDEYECTKDAYGAGGLATAPYGGGYGRALNIPLLNQCMASKGYTWTEKGLR